MFVVKADGTREGFDERKIIRTCRRAGASKGTAERIAREIRRNSRNGTTTHEIYRMILSLLRKTEKIPSFLFRLREALAELDSVSFELYTKKLMEAYSYKCKWDVIVRGNCVEHQVDVIAEKDGLFLVECKHHRNHHRFCGLGDVLQVQARLEDINDGFRQGKNKYNFKQAWMVTNTKFSDHAKKYAKGRDIILTGWGYKTGGSLERLIRLRKAFPITILKLNAQAKRELLSRQVITLQDLLAADKVVKKLGLDRSVKEAERLLS